LIATGTIGEYLYIFGVGNKDCDLNYRLTDTLLFSDLQYLQGGFALYMQILMVAHFIILVVVVVGILIGIV
jgi:hypothetical protein